MEELLSSCFHCCGGLINRCSCLLLACSQSVLFQCHICSPPGLQLCMPSSSLWLCMPQHKRLLLPFAHRITPNAICNKISIHAEFPIYSFIKIIGNPLNKISLRTYLREGNTALPRNSWDSCYIKLLLLVFFYTGFQVPHGKVYSRPKLRSSSHESIWCRRSKKLQVKFLCYISRWPDVKLVAFFVSFSVKSKGKRIEWKIVDFTSFVTVDKFSGTSALSIGWMTVQRTQLVSSISQNSITINN